MYQAGYSKLPQMFTYSCYAFSSPKGLNMNSPERISGLFKKNYTHNHGVVKLKLDGSVQPLRGCQYF
jgi:hypothetical protein